MPDLSDLVTSGTKTFGSGRLMQGLSPLKKMRQTTYDFPRLMGGIFPLDYAIGGGLPMNVATQFFGPPASGKSTLSYLYARALSRTCLRPGCMKPACLCECPDGPLIQKTFLAQFEGGAVDPIWLETLQYDADNNLVIGLPDYGEQGCTMIENAVKSDDCGLVIVDSVGAIMPKIELSSSYEDTLIGKQASLLTRFARRLSAILVGELRRGHLVSVIFLNQVRAKIGAFLGPTEGVPGGYALKHVVRLSVRFSQINANKDTSDLNMRDTLRVSASLIGSEAKQQVLILAGKSEFRIAIRQFEDYSTGACTDDRVVISMGEDTGVIVRGKVPYATIPSLGMEFRRLMDLKAVFRSWTPESDAIRYAVLMAAREQAVERLRKHGTMILQVTEGTDED